MHVPFTQTELRIEIGCALQLLESCQALAREIGDAELEGYCKTVEPQVLLSRPIVHRQSLWA